MNYKILPLRSVWRLLWRIAALLLLAPAIGFAAPVRLTFESAPDGAAIANSIPGLRFSVAGRGSWFYGDVRSGKYDAPYPQKAFAVDGNGFAWTGQQAGEGRIDFTAGTATFFAAAFSTKESLSIAAYNRKDQQIAAQVLRANANTGRLDTVRLEAPGGQGIAYVLISGTRNRWIMDNLETDVLASAPEKHRQAALVTVVQQPSPSAAASPDSTISYSIVATNRGKGQASNTIISVPFDPGKLRVVDARFSRAGAWVSKLLTDTLEIQTGPLGGGGDTITGTLRLAVQPGVAAGALLGERLSFRWSDSTGGGAGRSNLPVLIAADLGDDGDLAGDDAWHALIPVPWPSSPRRRGPIRRILTMWQWSARQQRRCLWVTAFAGTTPRL